jgi:hypothetical protein
MLLLISLHPVYGFSLHNNFSKQPTTLTPSGFNSSHPTSSTTPQSTTTSNNNKDSTTKNITSKAVITCVNSTIKNALIDALINRPLVNVNGSIRIDPTFVNHTITDIMGCIGKIENGLIAK